MTYTKDQLYTHNTQQSYPYDATECKFLLGGIGTGNFSVGTRGNLCDWEIFGGQGKGLHLPYSFFALRCQPQGGQPLVRVLESELHAPYSRSHGYISADVAGLPRFRNSTLSSCYPFVTVQLEDERMPLEVTMEAFTPFIPLDCDNSGIPAVVLRYKVRNRSGKRCKVTVAGSLANAVGFEGYDLFDNMRIAKEGCNKMFKEGVAHGLRYSCPELDPHHLRSGSMALATAAPHTTEKIEWLDGAWWDGAHDFWDDLCDDGLLEPYSQSAATASTFNDHSNLKIGSLGIVEELEAGEEHTFEFVIAWCFPNRPKHWGGHICPEDRNKQELEKNYYTNQFADAATTANYLLENLPKLEGDSRLFTKAFYGSTLPGYVLEAAAANITVLRSPTCFRIEDGTFLSWEGGFDKAGSCEGNCTHVWNYAQTAAFLFPQLEQSMRHTEFLLETDDDGLMAFRTMQVFGDPKWKMIPAVDGQMGCIVRLYRDWKLSGDNALLRKLWDKAATALDFAFGYWDSDGDCVLDNQQHNTYDIEFYGPNSLSNSIFLAALAAAIPMARAMSDSVHEAKYTDAFARCSAKTDKLLWGGEYYIQTIEDIDKFKYQYGTGCLSDQVFGQLLAHINGLGYLLPKEHVQQAILSVFRYNFRNSMEEHCSVQRTYALNEEKGLLLCSWPHGGRPKLPFVYSDEVWSGIEYQVAAHLIYEGFVDEGLTVVKAVRERYNGKDWNPWNEVECGNHYVRSMASWSVLLALSGYGFDLCSKQVSFAPRLNQNDFSVFFSTGRSWGIYSQTQDANGKVHPQIEVLYGDKDITLCKQK